MTLLAELQQHESVQIIDAEIDGFEVQFREPPMREYNDARKKYLKWSLVQKTDISGANKKANKNRKQEQSQSLDGERTDMPAFNRAIVMMTAYDPETTEKLFPDNAAFNGVFAATNEKAKNGGTFFEKFLKFAQKVVEAPEEPDDDDDDDGKKDDLTTKN